jgi:hypothetical protein
MLSVSLVNGMQRPRDCQMVGTAAMQGAQLKVCCINSHKQATSCGPPAQGGGGGVERLNNSL